MSKPNDPLTPTPREGDLDPLDEIKRQVKASQPKSPLNEGEVIEELDKCLKETTYMETGWPDELHVVLKKLRELGYRSPSEIRELERDAYHKGRDVEREAIQRDVIPIVKQAAMERVFEEIERERFAEPQHIPQSGKEPVVICLTETMLEVLKYSLLGKGERE